ncbi:hypothetical protein CMV_002058 [Castanea mollissima]|uniref:Nuclease HARBI1 n=1 Tax=Castanea mollissima TaxID=60419 RepID=A0A8J4RZJ7_9ROSI|nr:hypothetical protein CMV_002058 [Castanea mollissima]
MGRGGIQLLLSVQSLASSERLGSNLNYHETLQDIMKACIILHNMIVEDERDVNEAVELDYEQIDDNPTVQLSREHTNEFTEFIEIHQSIRDREIHSQLQTDLVEHLWQLQGEL